MNKIHANTHWGSNENINTNDNGATSRTSASSGLATTGQFQYVPTGWICPKCGRGLAPHMFYCPCYMERPTVTYCAPIFKSGDNPFGSTVTVTGLNAVDTVSNNKQQAIKT